MNCWDTECDRFIIESLSEFEPRLAYKPMRTHRIEAEQTNDEDGVMNDDEME